MKHVGPPDSHYLSAASGWLGLGNVPEARLEMEHLSPALSQHPEVLEVKCEICISDRQWEEALLVTRSLCEAAPKLPAGWIHLAYTLHELKRTTEAYDTLMPVTKQFPRNWLIRYNLACYACQRGDLKGAWKWLGEALALGERKEIKEMASEDPDLGALRSEIVQIRV